MRFIFTHVRNSIIKTLHMKRDALDLFIVFILLVFNLITFRLNKFSRGNRSTKSPGVRGLSPNSPQNWNCKRAK